MSARAFVIGNAAWDETVCVPVLPNSGASIHADSFLSGPGGKGLNQAVVLARAGIAVTFVAVVGRDENGDAIFSALAQDGLADGLVRLSSTLTDRSIVLVTPGGENSIITTRTASDILDDAMIALALGSANPGDLCVLQGNLRPAVTKAALLTARDRGMVTAFNPSPFDPDLSELIAFGDILFVNVNEANALCGRHDHSAASIIVEQGPARVILTLGAQGALLASKTQLEFIDAVPVNAVDPTGAGDSYMAVALAHAASNGWLPDRAGLMAAARAAALCVGRAGTFAALPDRTELASIMSS